MATSEIAIAGIESSINIFLTPYSRPYYEKVITILQMLQDALNSQTGIYKDHKDIDQMDYPFVVYEEESRANKVEILIFGGFLRNLLEHYYSGETENHPPKDVDIFIKFNQELVRIPSQTTWIRNIVPFIKESLAGKFEISNTCILITRKHDHEYCAAKMVIDGIHFDISSHINDWDISPRFDKLTDYTVNNLVCSLDSILQTRVKIDEYDLTKTLDHIRHKKLISILNESTLGWLYRNFDAVTVEEYLKERLAKMLAYGYTTN